MIKITPFQTKDQAAVKTLILDGLVDHWGTLDESLNPDLDDIVTSYDDGIFLVTWLDDEIIGTGAFKPHSEKQVEIVRMSVFKKLRRQGLGKQILTELCRQATQAGYEEVVLETTETWQDVIDFYLNYGFEITHYADGDAYFKMSLKKSIGVWSVLVMSFAFCIIAIIKILSFEILSGFIPLLMCVMLLKVVDIMVCNHIESEKQEKQRDKEIWGK